MVGGLHEAKSANLQFQPIQEGKSVDIPEALTVYKVQVRPAECIGLLPRDGPTWGRKSCGNAGYNSGYNNGVQHSRSAFSVIPTHGESKGAICSTNNLITKSFVDLWKRMES